MAVARDDLGRAARKRGIEGQVTIIRHFGIRPVYLQSVLIFSILNHPGSLLFFSCFFDVCLPWKTIHLSF